MILDATAGNRVIWKTKTSENIIYIDIYKKLQRKPTVFADNRKTPFGDKMFSTIFYDPPYALNDYHEYFINQPHEQQQKIKTYYGTDKIKSKSQMIKTVFEGQKEFQRILKPNGLLWLKWNDAVTPLRNIMGLFREWNELLRLHIKSPFQTKGKSQTYWVCFEKKNNGVLQKTLSYGE